MFTTKHVLYCIILPLLILFTASPGHSEFKKTKIAVLDFELRGDAFSTEGMGGIVAEWFTTTLVNDGRFEVVERALLKKIVEEQKLGMTGLIDEESSSEIGKILGVKTIITGSVLQIGTTIDVNARIINVKTGSIVAAENIRSDTSDNLREVIEALTARIVKNFPLTGYIVKKRDDEVIIDLGAASGLQIGTEFIVYKEGEVIKHPRTGEVLEVEQIRTGKISISEIGANIATGKIVEEEDLGIAYGQLVQSIVKLPTETKDFITKQTPKKSIAAEEKKEKTETGGYQRQELAEGNRDNLASGGQGPAYLPVPVGTFMMGSNRYSEKPQHFVNIKHPIMMTTTEITYDDYEKYCLETGTPFPLDSGWGKGERPVINVSWQDARDYAAWLTGQTGILYRLPTEAEWEWAAGAGTGTLYPWGNQLDNDLANCRDCGEFGKQRQTAPVRSFPANKFGLYDMVGNVWEWVLDCWVEHYQNAPEDQSPREISGVCGNYTIRGGAWNSPSRQATTTSRLGIWASTRSNYIGFRLVRDQQDILGLLPEKEKPEVIATEQAVPNEDSGPAGNAEEDKENESGSFWSFLESNK